MLERQRLFWGARLYDLEGSSGAFLAAMRANCAYHIRRCPDYRAVARALDFHPEELTTEARRRTWQKFLPSPPCFTSGALCSPCRSGGWPCG